MNFCTGIQDSALIFPQVEALSGLGSAPKPQNSNNAAVLQQLRQEIDKTRNRLAGQSPPNKSKGYIYNHFRRLKNIGCKTLSFL